MNTLGGKKKTQQLSLNGSVSFWKKNNPFSFGILLKTKCQKIPMTVFNERPWSGIQICSKQILNPTM